MLGIGSALSRRRTREEGEGARSAFELSGIVAAIDRAQAVIEFTPDGKILRANDNFLSVMGYELREIVGQHHAMFVDPAYRQSREYGLFWDKLRRGESESATYMRRAKDGREIWLQATYYPLLDERGAPAKVIKFANDVTDQHGKAESATRLRAALEACTTNVMVADADYQIIYMNQSIETMLRDAESELRKTLPHFDSASLLGRSIDVFHRNPAHQRQLLDRLNAPYRAEIAVGGLKFQLIATPVRDEAGRRTGTVVEWKNLTAEKNIEDELRSVIDATLGGDLTRRVGVEGKEGFMLTLATSINNLSENFASFVGQTQETVREVSNAASEIAASTTDLSQRTEEQAASLEETSASMEEMAATVKKNAESAQAANQLAVGARDTADRGGGVVASAVTAMARIEESSRKISDIIGVIDEIARQTNLLALNAAVEAARAGEAGRGFAVVASEVRSLAQRSSQAAKDIKELITSSNGQVKEGVDLVNRAGSALSEILESIKSVAAVVSDIATASAEQAAGIAEVNKALSQMDEATQQNSALVEENAATAKTLEQQASAMSERVDGFRISASDAAPAPARSAPARPASPARPPSRPAKPQPKPRMSAGRGAVGRMQAAVATAFDADEDWSEF